MVVKAFIIVIFSAALLFGHSNAECPKTVMDFDILRRWLADSVGMCYTQMMTGLRQSRSDCTAKVYGVAPCLEEEGEKCSEGTSDDMLKMMIQQSLAPFGQTLPMFDQIYCFANFSSLQHLTPSLEYGPEQQCSPELATSVATCATNFDQVFAQDPFDTRLCTEFDSVVDCQTDKAREYCQNLDESYLNMDIYLRQKMNFFCGGVDGSDAATDGNTSDKAVSGPTSKAPNGNTSDKAVSGPTSKAPSGNGATVKGDPSSAKTTQASFFLFASVALLLALL